MQPICSSSGYNHFDRILVQQFGKGSPDFVVLVETKKYKLMTYMKQLKPD